LVRSNRSSVESLPLPFDTLHEPLGLGPARSPSQRLLRLRWKFVTKTKIAITGIPDAVADGTRAGEAAAEGVR